MVDTELIINGSAPEQYAVVVVEILSVVPVSNSLIFRVIVSVDEHPPGLVTLTDN